MAELSYKARKKLPTKDFALQGRRFPIQDKSHAKNALARVSQHGSSEEKSEVRKKVHSKYPGIKISRGSAGRGRRKGNKRHVTKHGGSKGIIR